MWPWSTIRKFREARDYYKRDFDFINGKYQELGLKYESVRAKLARSQAREQSVISLSEDMKRRFDECDAERKKLDDLRVDQTEIIGLKVNEITTLRRNYAKDVMDQRNTILGLRKELAALKKNNTRDAKGRFVKTGDRVIETVRSAFDGTTSPQLEQWREEALRKLPKGWTI